MTEATGPSAHLRGRGWNGPSSSLHFREPVQVLATSRREEVVPLLNEAAALAEDGLYVVGFISYEASSAFDAAMVGKQGEAPLFWMAAYNAPDPERNAADNAPRPTRPPAQDAPSSERRPANETPHREAQPNTGRHRVFDPHFSLSREEHARAVHGIREHIHEGDVYQINLTAPLDFGFEGDACSLFDELVRRHPVPYAALIDTGHCHVLSCSPELFFERQGDRVTTRPMKGTVRRGDDPRDDEALEAWLASDPKSRAENLMIVDLLRNDLSRCCIPGSVRVPELFVTERYNTVIQMTSRIDGTLRANAGTADIFASLFPCGSVTGAPKIRAMEIIRDLERGPRGVYCGAIGYMHRDTAVFNVAIRTAVISEGRGKLGIGSGIVWDSDAADEYDESLLKARFLTDVSTDSNESRPRLIETMRADAGEIPLIELHFQRLRHSARALGYRFDASTWRARVTAAVPADGSAKVRTTLNALGDLEVTVAELGPDRHAWHAMVSDRHIASSDPYRMHKTTMRELYENEYRKAAKKGYDEVIFLNERGEIAEGSRSNVVLVVAGEWLTPPLDSGALPGVYRRHIMDGEPHVNERVLTPSDLERADACYLCNAVWGLVPARITLEPALLQHADG